MSQTSIIAGGLLVAYVVFIIVRGELPCYFQVLGIATAAGCPKGTVSANGLGNAIQNAVSSSSGIGLSFSGNPIANDPGFNVFADPSGIGIPNFFDTSNGGLGGPLAE